jgi:uncharacterized caspase-like protein
MRHLAVSIYFDFRCFALLISIFLVEPSKANENGVALVVGNAHYLHTPALANSTNDARKVTTTLRGLGFNVLERTDLKRAQMAEALRAFLAEATSARVLIIFYAGHGIQVAGRNYMVPVDAKLESAEVIDAELIEVDALLSALSVANRASILILDACRDNPLARKLSLNLGPSRSAAVQMGFAAYSTPHSDNSRSGTGVLVAFSTAPGTVALDGHGANSPFTVALTHHMATPGLEIRQMLTRVRADVAVATGNKQIPWDNSSLFGDVYLAGPAVVEPRPLEKPQQEQKNCFIFNGAEFCN